MLKRKLYKVGLVMSSLIPMAASSGSQSNTQQPLAVIDTTAINLAVLHRSDSNVAVKAPEIQLNKNVSSFVKEYIKKNGYFLGKTFPGMMKHIDAVIIVVIFLSLLPGIIEVLRARRAGRSASPARRRRRRV